MKINFTARHTEISSDMKAYCEKRLLSIEKVLGYSVEADIIVAVEKYRNKAEINVKTKGMTLNTVEETHDMKSSLGLAFDHIEKRVKKEREKLREKKRRRIKQKEEETVSFESEKQKKVIRSPNFSMKPMTLDEALLQFETSKKEVFVFRKFDSETWAVLFRRKDGHFGLVDPE
ncbi:ribosome hibernation-promoting factor, HPF/YfiA family [Acidobacteriota bacterium]